MQNTQIYPVIKIGDDYFSSNNTTFEGNYCKPILLNIPSIKQSVDIESRNFKISNVSLDLSNFPVNGERFSDRLSTSSLTNTEAIIYFVHHNTFEEVYRGQIRRISHDSEKVKVQLEDLTEKKTHKDLPELLDGNPNVPEKNRFKPTPMVYGEVERSPLLMSKLYDEGSGDVELLIDTKEVRGIFEVAYPKADIYKDSGLLIFNNIYASVNKQTEVNSLVSTQSTQWEYIDGDNFIILPREVSSGGQSAPTRLIDAGHIELKWLSLPTRVKTVKWSGNDYGDLLDASTNLNAPIENNLNSYTILDSENWVSYGIGSFDSTTVKYNSIVQYVLDAQFGESPYDCKSYYLGNIAMQISHTDVPTDSMDFDIKVRKWYGYDLYPPTLTLFGDGGIDSGRDALSNNMNSLSFYSPDGFDYEIYDSFEPFHWASYDGDHPQSVGIDLYADYSGGAGYEARVYIGGIGFLVAGEYPNPIKQDYYANVKGRVNTFDDHAVLVGSYFIQNPIDIIYDILRNELGLDANQINEDDYNEARNEHSEWKFAFTINKKINSKKLIEEIAKSTRCFPYFGNDGKFRFNTIKDEYKVLLDYENAIEIKEKDVINYSFKKTKPEQIYKQVDVQYKKDYAEDSYLEKTNTLGDNEDSYYGIQEDEAILEFESDYIRDGNTANYLNIFLSEQYKNDHLIFNLKLPLSYNQLEVGNLVKFTSLFNGVKAYGIDYTLLTQPNGQYYYPLFMIISTKKNIDSIQVECMQLHHLKQLSLMDAGSYPEPAWGSLLDGDIYPSEFLTLLDAHNSGAINLNQWLLDNAQTSNIPIPEIYVNAFWNFILDNDLIGYFDVYEQTITNNFNASGVSSVYTAFLEELQQTPEQIFDLAFGQYVLAPYEPDNGLYGGFIFKGWLTSGPSGYYLNYAYHSTRMLGVYLLLVSPGYIITTIEHQLNPGTNIIADGGNLSPDLLDSIYLDEYINEYGDSYGWDIEDPSTHHFAIFVGPPGLSSTVYEFNQNTQVFGSSGQISSMENNGYIQFPEMIDIDNPSFEIYDIAPNDFSAFDDTTNQDDNIVIPGDATGDGALNVLDVVTIVNWILGNQTPTMEQVLQTDLNGDGGLNVLDVVQAVNIILEG